MVQHIAARGVDKVGVVRVHGYLDRVEAGVEAEKHNGGLRAAEKRLGEQVELDFMFGTGFMVKGVFTDLLKVTDPSCDKLVFLAGQNYRQPLASLLAAAGYQIEAPMEGLTIGRQLQWLNSHQ